MELMEAIRRRHSVRQYTDRALEPEAIRRLEQEIAACNAEGDLHIRLETEEPTAFQGLLAHYGKFSNVRNYMVLQGPKGAGLAERIGYYGERLVLTAASLGVDSCWVAVTFRKRAAARGAAAGDQVVCVVALGYGVTTGVPHRSKPLEQLCRTDGAEMPAWFRAGAEAALLAPTAMNQQKFRLTLTGGRGVRAEALPGPYSRVDLGIVKYHFEAAAGRENFDWV